METYQEYRTYGIKYYEINGVTTVDVYGFVLFEVHRKGEQEGFELAKKYIDELLDGE